jgi:hypothetical protein
MEINGIFHGIPWKFLMKKKSVKCLCGIPWKIPWNSMEFNGIPWNFPWNFMELRLMEFHGLLLLLLSFFLYSAA